MKNAEMAGARAEGRKRGRFEVVPHPLAPVSWHVGNGARPKCAKVQCRAEGRRSARMTGLKGRNNKAQGNAPGIPSPHDPKP